MIKNLDKKSQNYIKTAIAFVCTTFKRQLLFALLQLITFVCTTTIENILTLLLSLTFVCVIAIPYGFIEQELL